MDKNHKITPDELEQIKRALAGVLGDSIDVEVETKTIKVKEKADEATLRLCSELEDLAKEIKELLPQSEDITKHILRAKTVPDGIHHILFGAIYNARISLEATCEALRMAIYHCKDDDSDD